MSPSLKKALQMLIPVILSGLMIWWVFSDPNLKLENIYQSIRKSDTFWVSMVVVITLLSHLLRAARWRLLMEPLGYKPSLLNTFISVMTGYFGNIFLPRGGEVMRSTVLTRTDKIPFATSFATVVADRVFDLFCLALLMGTALLFEFDKFMKVWEQRGVAMQQTQAAPVASGPNYPLWIILGLVLLAVAFLAWKNWDKITKVNPFALAKKFAVDLFRSAINSFLQLQRKGEFILYTVLIWVGYFLMTYFTFFCLPETSQMDMMAGLVMLVVGAIGMSVPASGGIGPFHIFIAFGMKEFYDLPKDDSLAYAAVLHGIPFLTVLFFGGLAMIWSFFRVTKDPQ